MPSYQLVVVEGHLGQDPVIRYTTQGSAVASLSIATKEKYKDKETTEWHRITAWGYLADTCAALKKGQGVYVRGRLQTRKWTDKDGKERFTTEIVAIAIAVFLPSEKKKPETQSQQEYPAQPGYDPSTDDEDSVPF